jgi:hypothetical protein
MTVALSADRKHTLGLALMLVSLASAVGAVLVILPRWPFPGFLVFLASAVLAGIGTWMKKCYCPRCRGNACTLPQENQKR